MALTERVDEVTHEEGQPTAQEDSHDDSQSLGGLMFASHLFVAFLVLKRALRLAVSGLLLREIAEALLAFVRETLHRRAFDVLDCEVGRQMAGEV